MNFNVQKDTIFLAIHGSHAYGLNNSSSDLDLRGICIEPIEFVVSFNKNFEQSENVKFEGHESSNDCTIFGLRKFAKLAADSNPNVLEILFVEDSEILKKNGFGLQLIENRNLFLSKKVHSTFSGYAKAQLKRLENHREWIINPPKQVVSREEFGLPSKPVIPSDQLKAAFAAIEKKLNQWNMKDMSDVDRASRLDLIEAMTETIAEMNLGKDELWFSAGKILGFDTNFLLMLDKERTYNGLKVKYNQYKNWQETRNPKRYQTEVDCHCDIKHASHLLRLYYEAIDVLNGKGLILKQPKERREFLLNIKNGVFGKFTYEIVMNAKDALEPELISALDNSKLPQRPDVNKIDELIRSMYLDWWDLKKGE